MGEEEAAGRSAKNLDVPRNNRLNMSMASRHSLLEIVSEDSSESAKAVQQTVVDDGSVVVVEDVADVERANSIQNTAFLATARLSVAMQEMGSVANAPPVGGYSTARLLQEVLPWDVDHYYEPAGDDSKIIWAII
ncbi:uncharacterized protein SPSK_04656 [Sporothrix schenckii 1099-18]|uniref:Uncharacterized protein n=1 Tax=Sporothrix schenckii 1099-18 TaxID=1397361 RepID=A0A0F2M3F4_SPOSC|nr:uncharacterized protein SPSK_04656 [Sporothrix schenckii 1099-18]KJR83639.1 hypothetical protein SPSK_04656 [Sporothrix schenckii 1099-18]